MKLALAGDTMLGRKVAQAIAVTGPEYLFAEEVVALTRSADLFVLNLECCISEDGRPWPDPRKPFFFRAPPAAIEVLNRLGVDCVTLANNHALDFGPQALLDTFDHLREAGIACVGAGQRLTEARAPAVLEAQGFRLAVLGCSDHPSDFAAGPVSPGIAYVDLQGGLDWLPAAIAQLDVDAVLLTPHWGPNMSPEPVPYVRRAAAALRAPGRRLSQATRPTSSMASSTAFSMTSATSSTTIPSIRSSGTTSGCSSSSRSTMAHRCASRPCR